MFDLHMLVLLSADATDEQKQAVSVGMDPKNYQKLFFRTKEKKMNGIGVHSWPFDSLFSVECSFSSSPVHGRSSIIASTMVFWAKRLI